jgi:hypothetical protein
MLRIALVFFREAGSLRLPRTTDNYYIKTGQCGACSTKYSLLITSGEDKNEITCIFKKCPVSCME